MKLTNWVVENWFLIVALAAVVGGIAAAVYKFAGLPTEKQKAKIMEWLVWACVEAEKELQSGTGQLKLREVYNMFCAVPAFSVAAKMLSFDTFEKWVKDALVTAKEMLVKNNNLARYVYGEQATAEVQKIKQQIYNQKAVI